MLIHALLPPPLLLLQAVGRVGQAAADVKQTVEYVEGRDKTARLMAHLQGIQEGLILVFVETKRAADHLEYQLSGGCAEMRAFSCHVGVLIA